MNKTIHYVDKWTFLKILEQMDEAMFIASFGMTVQLLDEKLKHIGSIYLNKTMEPE
jgi:hypothetical protein